MADDDVLNLFVDEEDLQNISPESAAVTDAKSPIQHSLYTDSHSKTSGSINSVAREPSATRSPVGLSSCQPSSSKLQDCSGFTKSDTSSCNSQITKRPQLQSHLSKNPYERSPAKNSHPSRQEQFRSRQLLYHSNVTGVLAVHGDSYTLTNGVVSKSVDADNGVGIRSIEDDVLDLRIGSLFVVNLETKIRWKEFKSLLPDSSPVKKIQEIFLDPPKETFGVCEYCREDTCHRWNAIVSFKRLLPTTVKPQPIPH